MHRINPLLARGKAVVAVRSHDAALDAQYAGALAFVDDGKGATELGDSERLVKALATEFGEQKIQRRRFEHTEHWHEQDTDFSIKSAQDHYMKQINALVRWIKRKSCALKIDISWMVYMFPDNAFRAEEPETASDNKGFVTTVRCLSAAAFSQRSMTGRVFNAVIACSFADVIGKLVFPSDREALLISTPFVFVQGAFVVEALPASGLLMGVGLKVRPLAIPI